MTKTPTGSAFPWGLLAQAVLLIISIIEEVTSEKKKAQKGGPISRVARPANEVGFFTVGGVL